jgi:hypothetical protein
MLFGITMDSPATKDSIEPLFKNMITTILWKAKLGSCFSGKLDDYSISSVCCRLSRNWNVFGVFYIIQTGNNMMKNDR